MAFEVVETAASRPAGGRPYSPALRVGDWLIVSGQAATGADEEVVGRGDPEAQWRQCLANIEELVSEAGGSMADVVASAHSAGVRGSSSETNTSWRKKSEVTAAACPVPW